jgi:hypothetical protein
MLCNSKSYVLFDESELVREGNDAVFQTDRAVRFPNKFGPTKDLGTAVDCGKCWLPGFEISSGRDQAQRSPRTRGYIRLVKMLRHVPAFYIGFRLIRIVFVKQHAALPDRIDPKTMLGVDGP